MRIMELQNCESLLLPRMSHLPYKKKETRKELSCNVYVGERFKNF